MGSGKKEANRKERQGKTGDGMGNVKVKGENFYRYAHRRCRPYEAVGGRWLT
jgi:nuclear GTP-binding protein